MLPQGRPCSTLVRVRYATAITVDERKYSRLMFESARLCFERRRMVKMITWLHLLSKISDKCFVETCINVT